MHLKDVSPGDDWAMMGQCACDTHGVLDRATEAPRFNGWVIVEGETEAAGRAPANAVRRDRDALREMGLG